MPPSFDVVVAETLDVIYASMYYRVRDRDLAMELTQETFAEAMASWHTFKAGHTPLPWLFRIARTVRARHFQRLDQDRTLRRRLESTGSLESGELQIEGVPESFKLLSHEDQEVLFLSIIAELKVSDVARHLGIKRSACSMRIQRALERLQHLMGDEVDA